MSDHPHKKNHMPKGTPPQKQRVRPGRNRQAKNFDEMRHAWIKRAARIAIEKGELPHV